LSWLVAEEAIEGIALLYIPISAKQAGLHDAVESLDRKIANVARLNRVRKALSSIPLVPAR
jgi:hypothetical protein